MADEKKWKKWDAQCHMCETRILMNGRIIVSIDSGAEFLVVPTIICGKCQSACTIALVEVDSKRKLCV